MMYDNKLHKNTKNFSSTFAPTVGIFSKKFLPVVEFLNKNSSGPEDIPEGMVMVNDTGQDDTCIR